MIRPIPPVAAALALAAQAGLARGSHRTPESTALGLSIAAPSAYILAGSIRRFHRAGTTADPRPGATATSLVTTGLHGRSRNPMYLGMAGVLLGHAVACRSLPALAPLALFMLWIDRGQITMEEAHLRERFGPEFENYARTVRRWL